MQLRTFSDDFHESNMPNIKQTDSLQLKNNELLSSQYSDKTLKKLPKSTLIFLTVLYMAQGIVIGNNLAVPVLMIDRNKSLTDLAILSSAFLPYSFKILLAPLIDSIYIKQIGYRKTWICLLFASTSIVFLTSSFFINNLMENGTVYPVMMILLLLTTTQAMADIAVDAWGITMLSDFDESLKTFCETTGTQIGQIISQTIFILFESSFFCNKYIRPFFNLETSSTGIITIATFYRLLGTLLMVITLVVFLTKEYQTEDQIFKGELKHAYKSLWKILKNKNVQLLGLWFSTASFFVICGDTLLMYKIQQKGVPRESLAILEIPVSIMRIVSPALVIKMMMREKVLNLYRFTYFCQLCMTICASGLVYLASVLGHENSERNRAKDYPSWFLVMISAYQIVNYAMLNSWAICSTGGFVNRIVDQRIAGTYITLVVCFYNFGRSFIQMLVVAGADVLSVYDCLPKNSTLPLNSTVENWNFADLQNDCENTIGGEWIILFDGYYIECTILAVVGFAYWWALSTRLLVKLESQSKISWKVQNLYD